MGQEKVYMDQESLLGWDRRRQFDGTEKVDIHPNKMIFGNKCPIFTRVKKIVIRIVR